MYMILLFSLTVTVYYFAYQKWKTTVHSSAVMATILEADADLRLREFSEILAQNKTEQKKARTRLQQ